MTEVESAGNSNDSNEVLLGRKLRLLRESRGYTIEDVSGQLYLDCSLIKALESGDYTSIPSQAYVKGYIRNFIKLFDAMPEFESFDLYDNKSDSINIIPESINYKKTFTFRYYNNYVLYVGIALIFLLGIYYLDVTFGLFSKVGAVLPESEISVENNVIEKQKAKPLIGSKSNEKLTVKTKDTKNQFNSPDSINMEFSHDSWAQVQDASGTELISRFVKSGEVLNLRGTLPFTIVLGNSRAVKISINGNNFNQSKYNKKEIAHFVINSKNLN